MEYLQVMRYPSIIHPTLLGMRFGRGIAGVQAQTMVGPKAQTAAGKGSLITYATRSTESPNILLEAPKERRKVTSDEPSTDIRPEIQRINLASRNGMLVQGPSEERWDRIQLI